LNHAVFQDDDVDFVIIANNENTILFEKLPKNVSFMSRPNIGYDFGGWSYALENIGMERLKSFTYFIFVNSSVIGPYLSNHPKKRWTDLYTERLHENIRLFGSTINMYFSPHVQSYIFARDFEVLTYLIKEGIFSTQNYAQSFQDAIYMKEIEMSRKIIENGSNIGSMLKYYNNVDMTETPYNGPEILHDVMYPHYENKYWTRDELIFIKGNRFGM
jgi:hypothetical protein